MVFQTASGQEVFRLGSGFGFELRPKVYRHSGCCFPSHRDRCITTAARRLGTVRQAQGVDRFTQATRPWRLLNPRSANREAPDQQNTQASS
jgi:hypothetical protein